MAARATGTIGCVKTEHIESFPLLGVSPRAPLHLDTPGQYPCLAASYCPPEGMSSCPPESKVCTRMPLLSPGHLAPTTPGLRGQDGSHDETPSLDLRHPLGMARRQWREQRGNIPCV